MRLLNVLNEFDWIETQLNSVYDEDTGIDVIKDLFHNSKNIAHWQNIVINKQLFKWWCYEVAVLYSRSDYSTIGKYDFLFQTFQKVLESTAHDINSDVNGGYQKCHLNANITHIDKNTVIDIDVLLSSYILLGHICSLMHFNYNISESMQDCMPDIMKNITIRTAHCSETIRIRGI